MSGNCLNEAANLEGGTERTLREAGFGNPLRWSKDSRGYVLWYCKSAKEGNQRDRTSSCRGSLHEREESEWLGMKEECYNVERDEQRCSSA